MPWKVDAPGCECCGCDRVEDDFGTDTITNYQQMSGSWSISGGELSTSSDNAVLKSTTTGLLYQQLATRFKSTGRKTVKLLGGMSSGIIYIYAQVEFDSSGTCGWLELRNKTAIGDSRIGERRRLQDLDPDDWHNLAMCVKPKDDLSEAAIYATLDGACVYAELTQTPSVGAGLGTGSGGSDDVLFDSFRWSDSKSPDNECPECDCPCESSFDNFNRADSETSPVGDDEIGCLWETCSNFWKISAGELVGWADANAQHLVPIDARSKEQYASVLCRGDQGTKALLYLGYECGSASMCAVVEFWDAPGRSKLAISNDNGSTYYNGWQYIDTTGLQTAAGTFGGGGSAVAPGFNILGRGMTQLEACLRDGKFYAAAGGQRISAGDSSAGTVPFAGLGVRYHNNGTPETGIRKPVFFDDFQAGKGGSPCGECDRVAGGGGGGVCRNCEDGDAPGAMIVTYPDLTGSCEACDRIGGNFIVRGPWTFEDGCCRWSSVGTCGCRSTGAGMHVRLCHNDSDGYYLEASQTCEWFGTILEKHVWKTVFGDDKPDCLQLDETLTLDSTTGDCSATGTTVRVRSA